MINETLEIKAKHAVPRRSVVWKDEGDLTVEDLITNDRYVHRCMSMYDKYMYTGRGYVFYSYILVTACILCSYFIFSLSPLILSSLFSTPSSVIGL